MDTPTLTIVSGLVLLVVFALAGWASRRSHRRAPGAGGEREGGGTEDPGP